MHFADLTEFVQTALRGRTIYGNIFHGEKLCINDIVSNCLCLCAVRHSGSTSVARDSVM